MNTSNKWDNGCATEKVLGSSLKKTVSPVPLLLYPILLLGGWMLILDHEEWDHISGMAKAMSWRESETLRTWSRTTTLISVCKPPYIYLKKK